MRIIAGEARGRPILAPEGLDTRPTLDRVRESLFNILQTRLWGVRVLDCFAGSGALAFEALSRGAKNAVLVDHGAAACRVIAKNVARLGMEDRVRLIQGDWTKALGQLQQEGAAFDLIFLDPPYRMEGLGDVARALLPLAAPGALFVLEYDRGMPPVVAPPLVRRDERRYGDTMLGFYEEGLP